MSRFRSKPTDEGSALLIAVLTVGVCISLALVGVTVAQGSGRSSGVDRQRLLAVNAAEAGIDSGYTAIQQGGLTPPCTLSNPNIKSGPDVASYSTTITYYDSAGATMACPLSGVPVKALLKSQATTNTLGGGDTHGSRTMEALVNINPLNGTSLVNAIFANGNLSFDNKTTITGNNGPDADVYTNADYSCANNENFAGSIYSQGTVTMAGSCTTAGNVWGKIVTESSWNGTIAGFVKAGAGTIKLSNPGSVTGNLYASSTINYTGGSGCTSGKCFPNGSPGSAPYQPFPIIRGDAATLAKWSAGTSTIPAYNVITDNTCGTIVNKIQTVYSQAAVPTLVSTSCLVALGNTDFALKNDLAIFTSGGLTTGNMTISSSPAGTKRNLHFIVPYDAVASRPCSTPVMDTDKQFDFTTDVELFVYSPCNVSYRNQSNHIGQIYGGSDVTIQNQFNMQFRPVPVLGVDPTSLPTVSYIPSIIYKRETV
jgi:hypothetical protein